MVYGYVRVSTKAQEKDGNSLEGQEKQILERYERARVVKEAFSGAKERPEFNGLVQKLEKGDTLVVCKLDRFCRNVKEGLEYIDILIEKGVIVHILNMGIIEDTPMGRMIITNLLAFAEFERAMIIERTQAGKEIARKDINFREGRPNKYGEQQIELALELLKQHTYHQVSEMTGISKSTLIRKKRKLKKLELD